MRILLISLLLAMTFGCVSRTKDTTTPADTLVDQQLRDSGEAITRDLAVLTGSQQNRDYGAPYGTGDLYTKTSLVWDGPIEGALSSIAAKVGFKFLVEGVPPVVPVLIHVKQLDRPALAIIRDIGSQTGHGEGVALDEQMKTIRLIYKGGRN